MASDIDMRGTKPPNDDPAEDPIISGPYSEPVWHWGLDEAGRAMAGHLQPGRRESMRLSPVPDDQLGQITLDLREDQKVRNEAVNEIRNHVKRWRDDGYPGAGKVTRQLLAWWSRDIAVGDSQLKRPFFAQLEAIETLIWAAEARRDRAFLQDNVIARSREHNDGLVRLCAKMATGTGKTAVMGMLIAWQHLAGHTHNFLVLAPSITVRERLGALLPNAAHNVYDDLNLLPDEGHLRSRLDSAKVIVTNWHQLAPKTLSDSEAVKLGVQQATVESEHLIAQRVLRGVRPGQRVCVINDEAHHCYLPRPGTKKRSQEDDNATVWFKGLRALRTVGHIHEDDHVYDFSATPIWADSTSRAFPDLFEWVVSDFSLMDAIESGLVKLPRAPVMETSPQIASIKGTRWRRLYDAVQASQRKLEKHLGAVSASGLPTPLDSAVEAVYKSWKERRVLWAEIDPEGAGPVIIFVVNSVAAATALHDWIAGRPDSGPNGGAQLPKLANYDERGLPISPPRTLLMHSKLDEPDGTASGGLVQHIDRLADALPSLQHVEKPTRQQKMEALRHTLNTVGKHGEAGEHVRCVVSVSMLTEGWDAQTVTHIVGFRAFSTQLLCEQVTGRALRRRNYELPAPGPDGRVRYDPEYAEVVGIPFEFMPGATSQRIRPPREAVRVETLPDSEQFRVWWPNIESYRHAPATTAFTLDPHRVKPWRADREAAAGELVDFAPVVGESLLLEAPAVADKRKRVRCAARVAEMLAADHSSTTVDSTLGNVALFRCAYAAVKEWSHHPAVTAEWVQTRFAGSDYDTAPDAVIKACVFPDQDRHGHWNAQMGSPPELNTSRVLFDTTLQDPKPVPDLGKTELSHTACHSHLETLIAVALSECPRVIRWVRNYRLGRRGTSTWTIPYYFDRRWRRYEPDFVAVLDDGSGLIVEGKGLVDDKSVTVQGHLACWAECASRAHADGLTPNCPSVWREVTIGMNDDPSTKIIEALDAPPLHD